MARYTEHSAQSLSRMWGVHQDVVKQWIENGDLKRSPHHYAITDSELQHFVDSEHGRALLNEARLAPNPFRETRAVLR